MAKHRANECKGNNYEPRKAYNAKANNNDNHDWDDESQNNNKNKNKNKRDELSSDDESDNHGRSKKHMVNVTKAVDFDSHVYSNNAVMGSTTDVNFNLLDKFNKSYSSDRTRDEGAMSFMGLSQLDASRTAKVGGTSKFTSRRDYQEAMAPRATSEATSDCDNANPTRSPVLRLRGAGEPDHGRSD